MASLPNLKSKIETYLSREFYPEQDVVYLLVEIYKFLEKRNKLPDFPAIRFYRNWACHSFLDKATIEKMFDEVYVLIRAKKYMDSSEWQNKMGDEIINSFSLFSPEKLKKELEDFSTQFIDSRAFSWKDFRIQLYEVIRDTPLLIRKDGEEIFRFQCKKLIAQVNFNDIRIEVLVNNFSFNINSTDSLMMSVVNTN